MKIRIVETTIPLDELKEISREFYKTMIKGVVDIEKEIVAFGGEFHMDANINLIEHGSKQQNIWGFNIHFNKSKDSWIEYTSLINIRPHLDNNDMEIQDALIRARIEKIVNNKII